jgi:hypothetical protein
MELTDMLPLHAFSKILSPKERVRERESNFCFLLLSHQAIHMREPKHFIRFYYNLSSFLLLDSHTLIAKEKSLIPLFFALLKSLSVYPIGDVESRDSTERK